MCPTRSKLLKPGTLFDWQPEIIYLLRVQSERLDEPFFPSVTEYHNNFGLTDDRLARARRGSVCSCIPDR
jgi:aspartate carbamoyltransferase catalytic subunit